VWLKELIEERGEGWRGMVRENEKEVDKE